MVQAIWYAEFDTCFTSIPRTSVYTGSVDVVVSRRQCRNEAHLSRAPQHDRRNSREVYEEFVRWFR
jgi:hypothetical protein